MFGGCSLSIQNEITRTLTDYFKLHAAAVIVDDASNRPPSIVELKKDIPLPTTSITQQGSSNSPSTSTTTTTNRPNSAANFSNKSSPEVLPPKQAKQSNSPSPRVMEDDLDDFLNLQAPRPTNIVSPPPPVIVPNSIGMGVQNFEAALRNIPSVRKKYEKFNLLLFFDW
jgi:hypothetical protein